MFFSYRIQCGLDHPSARRKEDKQGDPYGEAHPPFLVRDGLDDRHLDKDQ